MSHYFPGRERIITSLINELSIHFRSNGAVSRSGIGGFGRARRKTKDISIG
jgi:hypothetical protein